MSKFRVLISGEAFPNLERVANTIEEMGLEVRTSRRLTGLLDQPYSNWDVLLIDVEGMSRLLRDILPVLRRYFPDLTMIGLMSRSSWESTSLSLGFGDLNRNNVPDDVVVMVPRGAMGGWAEVGQAVCEAAHSPCVGTRYDGAGAIGWQNAPTCPAR